jgi:peptidoglycan hydrolase-like protein with peptidoglycan-binding domain
MNVTKAHLVPLGIALLGLGTTVVILRKTGATPKLPALKKPALSVAAGTPTIRQGDSGAAVSKWQAIVGVPADGQFGPQTKAATVAWQSAHGLTADGVVGPATWTKATVK